MLATAHPIQPVVVRHAWERSRSSSTLASAAALVAATNAALDL